jgi:TPR repeat protein
MGNATFVPLGIEQHAAYYDARLECEDGDAEACGVAALFRFQLAHAPTAGSAQGYCDAMDEVRSLLERSCTLGDRKGCLEAGFMHHVGFGGTAKDDKKAIEWLTRAIGQDDEDDDTQEGDVERFKSTRPAAPSATAAVEALFGSAVGIASEPMLLSKSHRLLGHIFSRGEQEVRNWDRALHHFDVSCRLGGSQYSCRQGEKILSAGDDALSLRWRRGGTHGDDGDATPNQRRSPTKEEAKPTQS